MDLRAGPKWVRKATGESRTPPREAEERREGVPENGMGCGGGTWEQNSELTPVPGSCGPSAPFHCNAQIASRPDLLAEASPAGCAGRCPRGLRGDTYYQIGKGHKRSLSLLLTEVIAQCV